MLNLNQDFPSKNEVRLVFEEVAYVRGNRSCSCWVDMEGFQHNDNDNDIYDTEYMQM